MKRMKSLLNIMLASLVLAVFSCLATWGAEVVIDDFQDEALEHWGIGAQVWEDGKGHGIEEKPYSLHRVTDPKVVRKDKAGLRVEFASGKAEKNPNCYGLLRRTHMPRPAEETDCLVFWIYKEAGGGDIKAINLFNSTSWKQFTAGQIRLDFDGWKQVVLKRDELRRSHEDMKWGDINYIQFVLRGDFVIVLSGLRWASSDAIVVEREGADTTAPKELPFRDVTPEGDREQRAAARGEPSLRLFSRNVLERCTYKTTPRPGETVSKLSVFGSPGEYEPVTFSVRSTRPLAEVSVKLAGDLVCPAGTIPAGALDVRVVSPMTLWLDTRRMREMEYLLIKQPAVDLAPDRTTRFWITVKIPEDAVPGTYGGELRVCQKENVLASIPYAVEVLPIRLSELDDMAYFMYFRTEKLPEWGQNKAYLTKCLRDMKEHGINAITAYVYPKGGPVMSTTRPGWVSMADTLEAIEDSGLMKPGRGKFIWLAAACYGPSTLRTFAEEVQKRGYEMLFYAIDEPGSERRNKQVRACVPKIREACPDVAITTAIGSKGIELVGDYYDVWICGMAAIDDARVAEAEAKGKRLWSYDCSLAPTDALTARHYFGYQLWRTGAQGAAFWAYCDGSAKDRFGLYAKDWTGYDPRLTYQHDFVWCVPEGPVPSVGWEAAREGIDDHRYLRTLQQLVAEAKQAGRGPAASEAAAFLEQLRARIDPANYGKAAQAARERAKEPGLGATRLYERLAPEPSMSLSDYNAVRRQTANHIIRLQEALGWNGRAPQ